MKTARLLMAAIAIVLVVGCGRKTTTATSPGNINTMGSVSSGQVVTSSSKPKYDLRSLLGKSNESVLKTMGTPDEIANEPNNAVLQIMHWPILFWVYNNKPVSNYRTVVHFDGPMPPHKLLPTNRVNWVGVYWTGDVATITDSTMLLVSELGLPETEPDAYYFYRGIPDYAGFITAFWQGRKSYLLEAAKPVAMAPDLVSETKQVNLQTNNLESSFHLSRAGRSFRGLRLRRYLVLGWPVDFNNSNLMDVGGPQYQIIAGEGWSQNPPQSQVIGGREILRDREGRAIGYTEPKQPPTAKQNAEWLQFASKQGWISEKEKNKLLRKK
jgi:hypothetical protein